MHRYWSIYSDGLPGKSAGDGLQTAPSNHSKRKSVLANYSLPTGPKKKAKTSAEGQGQEAPAAPEQAGGAATTDDSSASTGASAGAEGRGSAAAAGGSLLPSPALPYSELYAIFGDKLHPFLPTAARPGAATIVDVPAL